VLAAAEQAEAGTIQWRIGAPTYRSSTGAAWRCGPSAHRRRGQQAPAISTAAINTFLELKGIVSDPGQSACGRNSSDSLASQHPQRSKPMPARSPVHQFTVAASALAGHQSLHLPAPRRSCRAGSWSQNVISQVMGRRTCNRLTCSATWSHRRRSDPDRSRMPTPG